MTAKERWGSGSTRISSVEKAKNINLHAILLYARQNDRLESITVSEYKLIVETYFKVIRRQILEGKDYYIGQMGSLCIRFKERVFSNKIKGFYKEVHPEFLDKVLVLLFNRNKQSKKDINLIKFVWRRDVRSEAMNNVINNGYESIYLMRTKNDRKIKTNTKFDF